MQIQEQIINLISKEFGIIVLMFYILWDTIEKHPELTQECIRWMMLAAGVYYFGQLVYDICLERSTTEYVDLDELTKLPTTDTDTKTDAKETD